MRLLQLDIEGFRGAPDGVVELLPAGARGGATQIVGPSGSGKTSIVEAIALVAACVGGGGMPVDVASSVREGSRRAQIALMIELTEAEAEAARVGDRKVTASVEISENRPRAHAPPGIGKLFRASRAIEVVPENRSTKTTAARLPTSEELRVRALDLAGDKYAWVPALLASLAAADAAALSDHVADRGLAVAGEVPGKLEPVRAALSALHPTLRIGRSVLRDRRIEPGFEGARGGLRTFASLDRAEREALLFATLVVHLSLDGSVVVVDGIDQHVPAERCPAFIDALADLVGGGHLVVTSRLEATGSRSATVRLTD